MRLKSFAPIHSLHRHNNHQNWRILTFQLNCVSNKEAAYGQISEMAYDACRSAVLPVRSRLVFTYFTPTNQTVMSFRFFIHDSDSAEDLWKPSYVVINTIGAISGSSKIRLHSDVTYNSVQRICRPHIPSTFAAGKLTGARLLEKLPTPQATPKFHYCVRNIPTRISALAHMI